MTAPIERPIPTAAQAVAAEGPSSRYAYRVSWDEVDPAWDAFVNDAPMGYSAQTSLWGSVKEMYGWKALRITATAQGRLVGGVQVLARRLPLVGGIGYAPRGPFMVEEDPVLAAGLVQELCLQARRRQLHLLAVQPADQQFVPPMLAQGFRSTRREISPTYTLLLDLQDDPEAILSRMHRNTRRNIRLGGRKGMVVRGGGRHDLPTFHRLLSMTGRRQGFRVAEEAFYLRMWDAYRPLGQIQLLLAEYGGEPVAAQLALRCGEVAINRMTAWSGEHGECKPNEAVLWAAIRWAREAGCRYYDFGGMSAKAARPLLRGDPLPEALKDSVASFKLGFGGEVVAYPGTYLYLSNPILRRLDRELIGSLEESSTAKKLLHCLRTR